MGPENSNWNEYRLMILDWHNQDILEKKELRARLERQELLVTEKLTQIQTTLEEIQGSRKRIITTLNLGVPAAVALLVMGGQMLFRWLVK